MTTMRIHIDLQPSPRESADYIMGEPDLAALLDEAHAAHPDFEGEGLAAATEMVTGKLEQRHRARYRPDVWPNVRQELAVMVRETLLTDRELARKP